MSYSANKLSRWLLLIVTVALLSPAVNVNAQVDKAWEVSIPVNPIKTVVDPSGHVYGSVNFWASAENLNDLRIWKLDPSGAIVFNTTWNHQHDVAYRISYDDAGSMHLIGTSYETNSIPSPATHFSLVFDSAGALVDQQFYENPPGYSFDYFDWASQNAAAGLAMTGRLYNPTACSNRCSSIYNFFYRHQSGSPEVVFVKDNCPTQSHSVTGSAVSSAGDTYVSYYALDPDECHDAECKSISGCSLTFHDRLLKITSAGALAWDIAPDHKNGQILVDNNDHLVRIAADESDPANIDLNYVEKYNSLTGALAWSTPTNFRVLRAIVDRDNNVIAHGNSGTDKSGRESSAVIYYLVKYNGSTGAEVWRQTLDVYCTMAVDSDNNIYLAGYNPGNYPDNENYIKCYSPTGTQLFSKLIGIGYGFPANIVGIDNDNGIYVSGSNAIAKYVTAKHITVNDARGNELSNITCNLIKITHSAPDIIEDTLGAFVTDALGRLEVTPVGVDSFTVDLIDSTAHLFSDDILKVSKHVHSTPAIKHEAILGTAYSVHLDNAEFTEAGEIYFDTLGSGGSLNITLRHTELRYNLLVSVEWQASEAYLIKLMDNFANMSNYLYDVSDGQIRLDTVIIHDDFAFDSEADIHILADNYHNPDAIVGGLFLAVSPGSSGNNHLRMPRYWEGSPDRSRNWSVWSNYPMDLNSNSSDYRTKAHEFGHYALGFYDEYLFWKPFLGIFGSYVEDNSLRCSPLSIFNYGFMDHPYQSYGTNSSEMSSSYRYELESCQNTNQYGVLHQSCWDHLESWVEATLWGPDDIFVPILKPHTLDASERLVSNPETGFTGPNDDVVNLTYDVGSLIEFPVYLAPVPAGYTDKKFRFTVPGETPDKIAITLSNNVGHPTDFRMIKQGMTSDEGEIVVLGIKQPGSLVSGTKNNKRARILPGSMSLSAGQVTSEWYYSRVDLDTITADSAVVDLEPVYGSFPMIGSAVPGQDMLQLDFLAESEFSQLPQADHYPDPGGFESLTLSQAASLYSATIDTFTGSSGTFGFSAVDDSGRTFSVPFEYSYRQSSNSIWGDYFKITNSGNMVDVQLDTTAGITTAVLLTTDYPELRGNLDPNAVRAGEVASISVYPDNQFGPSNQITIYYSDADLKLGDEYLGDESSLQIYRWDGSSWDLVGGYVNSESNTVIASITQSGVYAAFTTQIVTDVEDDGYGDILPYQFELSQNYPNPFNPVTTIAYSLPRRSHVTIEVYNVLGQKVRTLVDREESAGSYTVTWDGMTGSGQSATTGVYLYRFRAGDHVETKKMLLLK